MLKLSRARNGTVGASRIFSVMVVAWLFFGCSDLAFPDEQSHLQLAPINFSRTVRGDLFYSYYYNRSSIQDYSAQQLGAGVDLALNARSFIWQPWFAQVNGSLGVGVYTGKAITNTTTSNRNTNLSGDANLIVLQRSRFPFMARIYSHENQASSSSNDINNDHTINGFNLSQKYKTRNDFLNSSFFYTRETDGRLGIGTENVTNNVGFDVTSLLSSSQTFRLDGGTNKTTRPFQGDNIQNDTLTAIHNYRPNSATAVASSFNLLKYNFSHTAALSNSQSNFNSGQLSSIGSWRPVGNPLTLVSSVRLSQSDSGNAVTSSRFRDSNFNLGVNYAWSRLLRTYGYVNVYDSGGIQTIVTNASLSAQRFTGDRSTIDVWGFKYTRSAGFTISNQTATTNTTNQTISNSSQSLGGNLGHALSKDTKLANGSLSIIFNQSLSASLSSRTPVASFLHSGASLAWHRAEGKGGTTSFGFRANDSRELSNTQRYSQLINLQASRTGKVSYNQSWAGDVTLQASRSGANNQPSLPFTGSSSAGLKFINSRLFGVRNLNFSSSLNIYGAGITTPLMSQTTTTWENNLEYSIGRLRLDLKTIFIEFSNHQQQSSLLFNAHRSF